MSKVLKSCLMIATLMLSIVGHARGPLLTVTPTITIPSNGTAVVEFHVKSNTTKTKNLILRTQTGLYQVGSCTLAGKDSTCRLTVRIDGVTFTKRWVKQWPDYL